MAPEKACVYTYKDKLIVVFELIYFESVLCMQQKSASSIQDQTVVETRLLGKHVL